MTTRIMSAVDVENEPWHESQRLLEMCCASVPFAQHSHRAPEGRDALDFITVSAEFPRSLRFCIREIDEALHRISRGPRGTFANSAERRLGRLRAQFDYTPIEELLGPGVDVFVGKLQNELEELSYEIEEAYFPRRLPEPVAS